VDTIGYYELKENDFEVKDGGRQDRGKKEIKKYVYIPINELITIENKNITNDIQPTMTDQPRRRNPQFAGCLSSVDASTDITANETETKDVRPLSYSQRLINSFLDKDKDTFNMKDIKEQIEEFSKLEYENRKKATDEMPFGKYKFKKVADVAKFDKQYLLWLRKQEMLENYEDLKEEINKHLIN
jgi:hypothetical protein